LIDGLIENKAVVEIKCPYVAKDTTSAREAVNNNLVSYLYVAIMQYDVMPIVIDTYRSIKIIQIYYINNQLYNIYYVICISSYNIAVS